MWFVAESFGETTKTVLSLTIRFAMILRTVWVLPVPGGPWMSEILLSSAASMASI